MLAICLHVDDTEVSSYWPTGVSVPAFGDGFVWKEETYSVTHAEWELRDLERHELPPGAESGVFLIYHITLGDELPECGHGV